MNSFGHACAQTLVLHEKKNAKLGKRTKVELQKFLRSILIPLLQVILTLSQNEKREVI